MFIWNFYLERVINRKLENNMNFKIDKEFFFIFSYLLIRNCINLVFEVIFLLILFLKKLVYFRKIWFCLR